MLLLLLLSPPNHPVWNLDAIMSARREIVRTLRGSLLHEARLTLEEAELLLVLFAAREHPRWCANAPDDEHFIPTRDLRLAVVESAALLSRRLTAFEKLGWVKLKAVESGATDSAGRRLHGNAQLVRLEPQGVQIIRPVWEEFRALAGENHRAQPAGWFWRARRYPHLRGLRGPAQL